MGSLLFVDLHSESSAGRAEGGVDWNGMELDWIGMR